MNYEQLDKKIYQETAGTNFLDKKLVKALAPHINSSDILKFVLDCSNSENDMVLILVHHSKVFIATNRILGKPDVVAINRSSITSVFQQKSIFRTNIVLETSNRTFKFNLKNKKKNIHSINKFLNL